MSAQGLGLKALYALLNSLAGVTSVATGGIYSYRVKQGAVPPFVLATEEGMEPQDTMTDATGTGATTNFHMITLSLYAKRVDTIETLAATIDAGINHYSGTSGGVVVDDIMITNADGGLIDEIYYKNIDIQIWTKQ